MNPDLEKALKMLESVLQQMNIEYRIVGSVASIYLGMPRLTLDADLVSDIKPYQVQELTQRLQPDFYVDEEMIARAVERRSSFNLIYLENMLKLDVFIVKLRSYDQVAFLRRFRDTQFITAEDVLLSKLEWYQMGGGVSDRQWDDILGVIRIQKDALDMEYLRHWAGEIEVREGLERALREAELE